MRSQPKDDQILRLVAVIRNANVRDERYVQAEQSIVDLGLPAVQAALLALLSDPERLVRDRAAELLKRLPESDKTMACENA